MMRSLILLFAFLCAASPASTRAEPADEASEPADESADTQSGESDAESGTQTEPETVEASPEDPLTARLKQLVDRYYTGIGVVATDAEVASALNAIRMLLLDGVDLGRIAAGVDQAIRLAPPGRRTPFEVGVPLRIGPGAETGGGSTPPIVGQEADPASESDTSVPPTITERPRETSTPAGSTTPAPAAARTVDPETEKRWEEAQERLKERRTRRRMYRQWRDRTRERRALLSLGIPLLATGYAIGFAGAGIAVQTSQADHAAGWAAAIPIVGVGIFMGASGISEPWPVGLTVLQGVGLGFTIAGLVRPIDWPYDRDPTALRVRGRSGRTAATLHFAPLGTGGALVGTF